MKYAIIVAGGSGTRMNSQVPKQFLIIKDKPLLMHTVEVFSHLPESVQIIVVLPDDQISLWHNLCRQYEFEISHQVVSGGNSRFQSVKKGLETIADDEGLVAIHDGVRPLVSPSMISESFQLAADRGSAVAAVVLKESIRKMTDNLLSESRNRSDYRIIQTPQTFSLRLLRNAYNQTETGDLTDDASVFEKAGNKVYLYQGDFRNLKITTPEDLFIAESLWKK